MRLMAGLTVVGALAAGGATLASAQGSPPETGIAAESSSESAASELGAAESASSESAVSDGPGGYADNAADASVDTQQQGEN
jgi:hypothetical protein